MPPDDYLSHASGEEFNYSHMSTEERALFTKVMFRWFSKAANDQLALLVDGWMVWRKRDKYLQAKAQNSLYSRRSLDAANIMRDSDLAKASIVDAINIAISNAGNANTFEQISLSQCVVGAGLAGANIESAKQQFESKTNSASRALGTWAGHCNMTAF